MKFFSPSVSYGHDVPFAVPKKTVGHSVLFLGFFDRGTNCALAVSRTASAQARYPRQREPNELSFLLRLVFKTQVTF